jgi:hypothetical protein
LEREFRNLALNLGLSMCIDCAEGFHELCSNGSGGCETCHAGTSTDPAPTVPDLALGDGFKRVDNLKGKMVLEKRKARRTKNDITLKDQQSTGRKRAVAIHGKADPEQPCEWQNKANCGGGSFPILGCTSGRQENLHHGPDKNTLNNERPNVHKICSQCHNRWHTLNDPAYQWDGEHPTHNPREEITPEDLAEDAARWKTLQTKQTKD